MFSRIRDRFGTVGLVVAVVALVAALGGSAYAASNALNGKQKKEVEKIAKKFAGKPGAPGANGTNGANGAAGPKGDKGDPGAPGAPGTNGKNVETGVATPAECPQGGATVQVADEQATKKKVCNGLTGFTEVLPSEKTETGAWAAAAEEIGSLGALSFAIPLAAPLDAAHVVKHNEGYNGEDEATPEHEICPGSAANPQAKAGYLCVYTGTTSGPKLAAIFDPSSGPFGPEGASVAGAGFSVQTAGGFMSGTFAVTAP